MWDLGLSALIAATLVLFAGWVRPLWIDEVLHFATGAMSWTDLLRTIDYTTIELNHGQTGVYFVADWMLLQIAGANSFVLRLPSLLSLGLLLVSAVFIMRLRQLGRLWEFVVVISLIAHATLMTFAAEARPYMPLAASAVAMLLLFMTPPTSGRPRIYRAVGLGGLFLGALMHAYWPLFLIFGLAFGIMTQYREGKRWRSLHDFSISTSVFWIMPAVVIYFAVGQLTWMRKSAAFDHDPFQWFGSQNQAINSLLRLHVLLDISFAYWIILGIATAISLAYCYRVASLLGPPAILALGGIATSVLVSALSISRGYWIFERQWVAGIALCAVGITWFFGELWREGTERSPLVLVAPGIFVMLMTVAAATSVSQTVVAHQKWNEERQAFAQEQRSVEELLLDVNDQSIVYAANVNVARREEVWPQFTNWYRSQAGMRPEFRELNPSWTQWLWGPDEWESSQ